MILHDVYDDIASNSRVYWISQTKSDMPFCGKYMIHSIRSYTFTTTQRLCCERLWLMKLEIQEPQLWERQASKVRQVSTLKHPWPSELELLLRYWLSVCCNNNTVQWPSSFWLSCSQCKLETSYTYSIVHKWVPVHSKHLAANSRMASFSASGVSYWADGDLLIDAYNPNHYVIYLFRITGYDIFRFGNL